jgi:hypothetical protein
MQHTYGIFEAEADHLIELVRRHAPLAQVRAAGCPVCAALIAVEFADDGGGFSMSCEGQPLHVSTYQAIADPPPWWRACVVEPADSAWYWRADHSFDAAGNLSMPMSGWTADGVRWSGAFACPVDHADHPFWRWVLFESGCTSALISDAELSELRARFTRPFEPGAAADPRRGVKGL